jgi:hypothetical protein
MSVSWFLVCDKCEKARSLLWEVNEEIADSAEDSLEARFYLREGDVLEHKVLIEWIKKHEHGVITYDGEA